MSIALTLNNKRAGGGEVLSTVRKIAAKNAHMPIMRLSISARVKTGNGFSVSVNLPLTLATRPRYRERYISSPLRGYFHYF